MARFVDSLKQAHTQDINGLPKLLDKNESFWRRSQVFLSTLGILKNEIKEWKNKQPKVGRQRGIDVHMWKKPNDRERNKI